MTLLILLSVPFGLLGYLRPRWSVLVVPYLVWAGFGLVEELGFLPSRSGLVSLLLAGTIGAAMAVAGLLLRRVERRSF